MPRTTNDYDTEIRQLRARLAEQERERKRMWDDHNARIYAVTQVRGAIDEAIAFTARWSDMARLDPGTFQAAFQKRLREVGRLNQYFVTAKSRFEDVLNGKFLDGETERFEHEDDRDNPSEVEQQGSSEQELSGDSGQAANRLDDTRSNPQQ